jgi:NAD(P)-dependent dehydrogenase (short-subunit alcohol dehydrogenase family)
VSKDDIRQVTSTLNSIGNTGLGLEVVRALYASPKAYEIIIGCRTPSSGEEAIKTLQSEIPKSSSSLSVVQVDLASDSSIDKALETISSKYGRLDVLVNNGGASFDAKEQSGEMTLREAWNASWNTNVSGTHVLTTGAIPLLLKSSDPRILFVTSGTSSLAETQKFDHVHLKRINASPEAGWPKTKGVNPIVAYRSSKTGLNMLVTQWARILKNDGVKVFNISPGFLATGLGGVGRENLLKVRIATLPFDTTLLTLSDGCNGATCWWRVHA